jgi:amino acid adenylation domain-containing protein
METNKETGPGSIPARFEEIVERHSDRMAIKTLAGEFSYRELNEQANRIAHAIITRHDQASGRIALMFEQSVEAIASILGVLKSGQAFVSLDAADSSDRMRAILQDCRPTAILTSERHAESARQLSDSAVEIIVLDSLPPTLSCENPGRTVAPDAMAYLFYTSGSTGEPKGVAQTHRNLHHFVRSYCATLALSYEDRLSMLYSLSFSASNMDVFGALLNGAALFPYDIRKRGTAAMADWLDTEGITILHAVPTVFRHLTVNLPSERRLKSIRAVDLGGEAVHPSDIVLFRDHFRDDCALINHLAATEASVIAQYSISREHQYEGDMLPVGSPGDGVKIRIIREDGSDAAVSEPGEMVVYSPFLSPGYWQRPDLTAAAFREAPDMPGWRIYQSGDLGYFGPDQKLYFLGRKDSRVKVRGHTVDTSEIEAALRESPSIHDVAVVVKSNKEQATPDQLVACLVAADKGQHDPDVLRQDLREKLPSYMIPSQFVFLDSLPVTPSGKIDRKELSRTELKETRIVKNFEAPTGELECQTAALFEQLLQHQPVGRADDFFLLGGDSLKATQLHLHLEDFLGVPVPLESLFADATVAGISKLLRDLQQSEPQGAPRAPQILIPLRKAGPNPILFLLHGAKGQAFVSPHFLKTIGDDQPVYAFQATGLDRSRMPRNTIEEMAAEYVRAIKQVQAVGPYFLGSLCAGSLVTIEMAKQLREADETVGPLLLIDPPVIPPGDRPWSTRLPRLLRVGRRKLFFRMRSNKKKFKALRERHALGRIELNPNDVSSMNAAVRVAIDFELALIKYKLKPYDGPALILGSSKRLAGKSGSDQQTLTDRLTGEVQWFNVGEKHGDVHDVTNELFARQLQSSVAIALEAIAGTQTNS